MKGTDRLRKILSAIMLLLSFAVIAKGQDTMSVAERNALQGFNDTIDREADDFVTVSLVVCDPGEVLYSTLGHAALHLQCPTFGLDYIYTYESENVRDKILTFLKGNLRMGMFGIPAEEFTQSYVEEGRGVKEYKMNLSPKQKQELWRVIDQHVAEGADVPYDYFHRGCAKSVVYIIHETIGKKAIYYAPWQDKYTKQTQRELVRNFLTEAPWEEFMMYFLIGTEGDKSCPPEQKLIIPTDLVEVWQQARLDNGKTVIDSTENILAVVPSQHKGTWCTPLFVSFVLLLLALFSVAAIKMNRKQVQIAGLVVDYIVLVIATCAGALMTYLVVFSGLPCTEWNWLIIPFNILPAIGWHWRRYWSLPYALVILVWCVIMAGQFVWGHVLVDWAHIVLALSFGVVLLKQRYAARLAE